MREGSVRFGDLRFDSRGGVAGEQTSQGKGQDRIPVEGPASPGRPGIRDLTGPAGY